MTIDPVLGGLVILLVVLLVSIFFVSARRLSKQKRTRELVEHELTETQRQLTQLEREQRFVTSFIREFPQLIEELTTRLKVRQLPDVLLEMMKRAFGPDAALVLFRRRTTAPGGQIERPLVVVRNLPADGAVERGTEIAVGQGELGFVAEAQRAMSQDDFRKESRSVYEQIRKQSLPGFRVDLAAPMIFDEKTVGVLAVSGIRRHPSAEKEVIRLMAQIGAMTAFSVNAYSKLQSAAELDGLTKTLNKAAIAKSLSDELIDAEKQKGKVSIFFFDIDNFKQYNDLNGHLAGDKLLADLARLVKEMTRADDSLGRFGGEEFLLLLPDTNVAGALCAAEKLRAGIAHHAFPFADGQPLGCVSVSGGVATFPDDARDSATLLRLADQALYAAKGAGRNRVQKAESGLMG